MLSSPQMFVCFPFLHNIICDLKQDPSPISQPVFSYRKQGDQTKWPFPHPHRMPQLPNKASFFFFFNLTIIYHNNLQSLLGCYSPAVTSLFKTQASRISLTKVCICNQEAQANTDYASTLNQAFCQKLHGLDRTMSLGFFFHFFFLSARSFGV